MKTAIVVGLLALGLGACWWMWRTMGRIAFESGYAAAAGDAGQ